ncbi:MAG: hypothetical protein KKH98_09195 [Spirochaetes bacterium]|nr:hypothetical protein [Spirochaetota bacterium]
MSNGNLDPELADLLSGVDDDIKTTKEVEPGVPASSGPPLTSQVPVKLSSDKAFLKKVIEGESNEYTQRMIEQLDKAINTPIKEDRTIFRQKLIPTYWNFVNQMVINMTSKSSTEKTYCVRFGIVDITLLTPNQVQLIKSIPMNYSSPDYPFYYMDEWLKNVSAGNIKPSMVDEVAAKKSDTSAVQEKLDRKMDSKSAELRIFKNRAAERALIEKGLQSEVNILLNHSTLPEYENASDVYTQEQKNIMSSIMDDMRKLKNADNGMVSSLRELRSIDMEIRELQGKTVDGPVGGMDERIITNEFNSLRQMAKMCVGPRGNHFPILISDYAPASLEYVNTKEQVIGVIQKIEERDAGIFIREFKGQQNRIVPYIILVTAYGEQGICWEPFDMRQRATSRGRIAVPLYPRDPMYSLLCALGDLRWQVAKEKAAYRWMEEGVTGKYFDYFTENKLRGNIKDEFIKDYILWITQEWNATQKLHRDVRMIFWRYMPFPQSKKDELKNRGFFYNDLYKKDMNRAMSDGY